MSAKRKSAADKAAEQSERFMTAARGAGAGDSSKMFERAFKRVVKKKQAKSKSGK